MCYNNMYIVLTIDSIYPFSYAPFVFFIPCRMFYFELLLIFCSIAMLLMPILFQQILIFFVPHTYSINVGESEIHIGSVIERRQDVILYDHSIEVKINALEFLKTPDILDSILENIDKINSTLISKKLTFDNDHDYSFRDLDNATTVQLLNTLDLANQKLISSKIMV